MITTVGESLPSAVTPTDEEILINPQKYLGYHVTFLDDTSYGCWAFAWEASKIALIIIYAAAVVCAVLTVGIATPYTLSFILAGGVGGIIFLRSAIDILDEKAYRVRSLL